MTREAATWECEKTGAQVFMAEYGSYCIGDVFLWEYDCADSGAVHEVRLLQLNRLSVEYVPQAWRITHICRKSRQTWNLESGLMLVFSDDCWQANGPQGIITTEWLAWKDSPEGRGFFAGGWPLWPRGLK